MTQTPDLFRPKTAFDVLRLPLIGGLLRRRYGRLMMQIPLLLVALLLIYDGFTGSPRAGENLATIAPWVHYRGLVVIALLLVGNLFCMGCPFTLPRTLAKRLSLRGRRFPRLLRNKWIAIAGLFLLFFLYEWLDLWSSPCADSVGHHRLFRGVVRPRSHLRQIGVLQVRLPVRDVQLCLLDRFAAPNRRARPQRLP